MATVAIVQKVAEEEIWKFTNVGQFPISVKQEDTAFGIGLDYSRCPGELIEAACDHYDAEYHNCDVDPVCHKQVDCKFENPDCDDKYADEINTLTRLQTDLLLEWKHNIEKRFEGYVVSENDEEVGECIFCLKMKPKKKFIKPTAIAKKPVELELDNEEYTDFDHQEEVAEELAFEEAAEYSDFDHQKEVAEEVEEVEEVEEIEEVEEVEEVEDHENEEYTDTDYKKEITKEMYDRGYNSGYNDGYENEGDGDMYDDTPTDDIKNEPEFAQQKYREGYDDGWCEGEEEAKADNA